MLTVRCARLRRLPRANVHALSATPLSPLSPVATSSSLPSVGRRCARAVRIAPEVRSSGALPVTGPASQPPGGRTSKWLRPVALHIHVTPHLPQLRGGKGAVSSRCLLSRGPRADWAAGVPQTLSTLPTPLGYHPLLRGAQRLTWAWGLVLAGVKLAAERIGHVRAGSAHYHGCHRQGAIRHDGATGRAQDQSRSRPSQGA
jgi:hypothetical protein